MSKCFCWGCVWFLFILPIKKIQEQSQRDKNKIVASNDELSLQILHILISAIPKNRKKLVHNIQWVKRVVST